MVRFHGIAIKGRRGYLAGPCLSLFSTPCKGRKEENSPQSGECSKEDNQPFILAGGRGC